MSKREKKLPTKKELLKGPTRKWDDTSREYDRIWLVPAGTKHDSGYMHIAVIGVWDEDGDLKWEVCGWPDDISCMFPTLRFGDNKQFETALVRMDCYYPSGVLQYHGRGGKFTVGPALSSIDIFFKETEHPNLLGEDKS